MQKLLKIRQRRPKKNWGFVPPIPPPRLMFWDPPPGIGKTDPPPPEKFWDPPDLQTLGHVWPELPSLREELKRLLTHKKNPIMAEVLQIVRRSYSSLICRERSNSWRSFCTKAEAAKEISTLVQIVGNDKIRGVSLLRQGDTFTISAEESLDFLLKQHFPLHLSLREKEQLNEEEGKYMNSDRSEEMLQYFLVWRVKATTASFQPMKAAGPDDLKPVVLQHIGDVALAKITNFFKRSMVSSFIPKRWRHGRSSGRAVFRLVQQFINLGS